MSCNFSLFFFFFNDTATTEIYTLSLHDALPILRRGGRTIGGERGQLCRLLPAQRRSEEHTSELQSRENLVCRLLLERKKEEVAVGLGDPRSELEAIAVAYLIAYVMHDPALVAFVFFFKYRATTEILPLPLRAALPI